MIILSGIFDLIISYQPDFWATFSHCFLGIFGVKITGASAGPRTLIGGVPPPGVGTEFDLLGAMRASWIFSLKITIG